MMAGLTTGVPTVATTMYMNDKAPRAHNGTWNRATTEHGGPPVSVLCGRAAPPIQKTRIGDTTRPETRDASAADLDGHVRPRRRTLRSSTFPSLQPRTCEIPFRRLSRGGRVDGRPPPSGTCTRSRPTAMSTTTRERNSREQRAEPTRSDRSRCRSTFCLYLLSRCMLFCRENQGLLWK